MSYVSENDMKEFFQNVIDSVAQLSTQASKVEGLTQQINDMATRLQSLEQRNVELGNELREVTYKLDETQGRLSSAQASLDNEKAVTASLRETIIQRDAGVQNLEQAFRNEQDSHKIAISERDDARQKVSELESEVQRHNQHINDLSTDRDTWRSLAVEHEREVNHLKRQLEQINSVLNPLRVVSSDVA